MGAGDAKLMGAVGAVTGAGGVFAAFLLTALYGGIYALVLVLVKRRHFQGFWKEKWLDLKVTVLTRRYTPGPKKTARPRLCYGLAIAAGSITYLALSRGGYGIL
jgi:prepilin peptidase CpaA